MSVLDVERLIDDRIAAIRKFHADAQVKRAELDLSGGIDSAVMAGLLVLALGPDNVTLAHTKINTSHEQSRRARDLAIALDCRLAVGHFSGAYNVIIAELLRSLDAAGYDEDEIEQRIKDDPTILGSIRSTLRAPLGRAYNRLTGGGIRHGTGNECEDRFLRFYQKGGDGEVDTNPLAMLSKTEVYQLAFGLARRFNDAVIAAFTATINAVPSPDLWGFTNHSDEAELFSLTGVPFTYGRIDALTGKIMSFGTIERVARFLDTYFAGWPVSHILFGSNKMSLALVAAAKESGYFDDYTHLEIEAFLSAANRIERLTRHKMNSNCPALGDRAWLVTAGILTNDLILEN